MTKRSSLTPSSPVAIALSLSLLVGVVSDVLGLYPTGCSISAVPSPGKVGGASSSLASAGSTIFTLLVLTDDLVGVAKTHVGGAVTGEQITSVESLRSSRISFFELFFELRGDGRHGEEEGVGLI